MAIEPTEIMAIAASPWIFLLFPVLRISTALKIVIGRTRNISLVRLNTEAIQIAPNATWESPSPINENLFNTKVTPKREEQREIRTPTIKAYCTNGKLKYCANVFIIFLFISKKYIFTNMKNVSGIFLCSFHIVGNHNNSNTFFI